MDNKVLDEAVEVAGRIVAKHAGERWDDIGDFAREVIRETQRAALLASLPVLLGEPVAWLAGSEHFYNEESARMYLAVGRKAGKPIPLYAPSLGEGDGR